MSLISLSVETSSESVLDKINSILKLVTKTGRIEKKLAETVRDGAKKRAPVDTGQLEERIEVKNLGGETTVVSSSLSADGFNYAAYLHETREWKLGPKSKAKDASQPEKVGPKWLTRAISEQITDLNKIAGEEAQKLFKDELD